MGLAHVISTNMAYLDDYMCRIVFCYSWPSKLIHQVFLFEKLGFGPIFVCCKINSFTKLYFNISINFMIKQTGLLIVYPHTCVYITDI